MSYQALTIPQLRDLINTNQATDPLVFLESVMNGQDPRRLSAMYTLIMEIDSFCDGDLSKSDWNEIVDLVSKQFKYHEVSLSESTQAAKTLSEYIHAKRKQIEKIDGNAQVGGSATPLTHEDIELFKEKFNDDF